MCSRRLEFGVGYVERMRNVKMPKNIYEARVRDVIGGYVLISDIIIINGQILKLYWTVVQLLFSSLDVKSVKNI